MLIEPFHTKGLPGALEQEAYCLLLPLMRRYAILRKSHLSLDRIAQIVKLASDRAYAAALDEMADRSRARILRA
jgi:hypothetical protein